MYDYSFSARSDVHDPVFHNFSSSDDSKASWSSLVGIVTAIVGNVIISFALNTQRYAHIRIDREFNRGEEKSRTVNHQSRSTHKYGAVAQQEQAAEERERLNAEAPGLGNKSDDTNAFGHTHHRKNSLDSDATARPPERNGAQQEKRQSYLRSPVWWIGIILMAIGETGNFLAYGFAPASIVSPLGVVALISNCLIAPLMLKERFRQRDFWGVLISIGGAVTVVLSAETSEVKLGPNDLWEAIKAWEFLTYTGITCALIVALMVASPKYGTRTILIDLGLVGLFGGYTALSTKGIASMLSGSLFQALTFPITWGLIAILVTSAIMQIRYINRALSNFDSTSVIPTQFVLFTLSVIIGSAVLYRDFKRTTADHAIKFIIGCLLTFSGVWLITSGRKHSDDHEEETGTHDETIHLIDEEVEAEAIADDERTPLKREQSLRVKTNLARPPMVKSYSVDDATNVLPTKSPSLPSVPVTPYDIAANENPWISSSESLNNTAPPKTPPSQPDLLHADTPFFTPHSLPSTASNARTGLLTRSETSPAHPETPKRQDRAPSPPKPDLSALPPGEVVQTPHTTLFRSARGSISRLLPGPFLGPLSSSSLTTVVAESLLKGEGSPQGPIRSRSYKRPLNSARTERNRRRSVAGGAHADMTDLESGVVNTDTLSRWTTRDSANSPSGQRFSDDLGRGEGSSNTNPSRLGLMPSLSPTFSKFMNLVKERGGKEPERHAPQ